MVDTFIPYWERQYHSVSVFLKNTINTTQDICFFRSINVWHAAYEFPVLPIFLPFGRAQNLGFRQLTFGACDLNNVLIPISQMKLANRQNLVPDIVIVLRSFLSYLRTGSFTILLDEPAGRRINFEDLERTVLDKDTQLDDTTPHKECLIDIRDYLRTEKDVPEWSKICEKLYYARLRVTPAQ